MPWKKAWPTSVKDQLKTTFGLTDKQIALLEGYGSLETLQAGQQQWQVQVALDEARAARLLALLKQAGL